jgi:hypothetical protein
MQGMMVPLAKRVECFAKIAITVLLGSFAAMDLLPKPNPPRRIFLGVAATPIFSHQVRSIDYSPPELPCLCHSARDNYFNDCIA